MFPDRRCVGNTVVLMVMVFIVGLVRTRQVFAVGGKNLVGAGYIARLDGAFLEGIEIGLACCAGGLGGLKRLLKGGKIMLSRDQVPRFQVALEGLQLFVVGLADLLRVEGGGIGAEAGYVHGMILGVKTSLCIADTVPLKLQALPSAAKRFDEQHVGGHLFEAERGCGPAVVQ